ncbi:DUF4430 domain-containing protein [Caldibacillus thermoamylovorans]|nr:DUF4430 domain-containing protein [Caldibacillus thermoamylovorans]
MNFANRVGKRIFVFIALILLITQSSISSLHHVLADTPENKVNVSVMKEDGSFLIERSVVDFSDGDTAGDVLKKAATDVTFEDSDYGPYLKAIKGVVAEGNKYWGFFVNGIASNTGVMDSKVKPGDQLLFRVIDWTKNPTVQPEELSSIIEKTAAHLLSNNSLDWYGVLTLSILNKDIPQSIIDSKINEVVANNGEFRKVTDLENTIILLTAAGKDATNIEGINLIDLLVTHERMINQGNNGPIFALWALDSGNYTIQNPNAEWTREKLINHIIGAQLDNGAWSLYGPTPSVDITAMTLTALAPYSNQENVKAAIEKAVAWLSATQTDTAGYYDTFNGGESSESIAQVIAGLCANNIDPTGNQFTKSELNLVQRLLHFQKDDNGFAHLLTDDSNSMATNQAFFALTYYQNFLKGEVPGKEPNQPEVPEPTNPETISPEEFATALNSSRQYLLDHRVNDLYSTVAFNALGVTIPSDYIDQLINQVTANKAEFRKVTDLERTIISLTAAGKDATKISGYNLIEQLVNHKNMTNQGNNGPIYALLALDSGGYPVNEKADWTREKIVDYIVKTQLDNGAWSLAGETPSADLTGIAIAALAPYSENENVQAAIEKAVDWLSSNQTNSSGFYDTFAGGEASESIASVIIGLSTAGIDPTGSDFTKAEGNLVKRLLDYQIADGGFTHLLSERESNPIASSQATLALAAYQKYKNNQGSVFHLVGDLEPVPIKNSVETSKEQDQQVSKIETTKGAATNLNGKEQNNSEKTLPETATNTYLFLFIGIILVTLAVMVTIYQHRKKAISK